VHNSEKNDEPEPPNRPRTRAEGRHDHARADRPLVAAPDEEEWCGVEGAVIFLRIARGRRGRRRRGDELLARAAAAQARVRPPRTGRPRARVVPLLEQLRLRAEDKAHAFHERGQRVGALRAARREERPLARPLAPHDLDQAQPLAEREQEVAARVGGGGRRRAPRVGDEVEEPLLEVDRRLEERPAVARDDALELAERCLARREGGKEG
jgi:hypothetical protein